jgi:acetoin utilization protein AcuB
MSAKQPTVAEFMTLLPASADEDLLLADAEERMRLDNIRHLVVVGDGHIVGVLSSRDIGLALSMPGSDPKKLKVKDAMSEQPFVCRPDSTLAEVCLMMEAHRWGCAIVVDHDEVVGVFTTTDALRAVRALATGQMAVPAVMPDHLPPIDPGPRRKFMLRKHKPIEVGQQQAFNAGQPGV